MNGDSYADVILGGNFLDNGETDEGRAFVYLGNSGGLSSVSSVIYESNQENSNFGYSVSIAGDVNGDGYSDVIVGAYRFNNGQTDEGAAFVYHGSASGLSSFSNWSADGNQASAWFGTSVSTAGDVNGDGYSDVMVGAHGYDNGPSNEGAAFVFHGSASGLSLTSNWRAEGNQTNAYFGTSVSTAGDVNGDGYSDVIIGAIIFSYGNIVEGAAFVYHGSALGLSPYSNWSAEGNQNYARFGYSVYTTGDVNGDGYSDVIVGEPYFNNGKFTEGAAYVYYGGNSAGGLQSTVRQYKYGTSVVVTSGSNTGESGKVRLQHFARSPFGRSTGRIVYEIKENGIPFSGSIVSNSTSSNGTPSPYTSLGLTGTNISQDMTGFNSAKLYKWRARVQYKMTSSPFQKFSPWRYYSNYVPMPSAGFRPKTNGVSLNLTMFIEGFYDNTSNTMISDTVKVFLKNSASPYLIIDSAKAVVSSSGTGIFNFQNAVNGTPYYLVMKHRNSIETWSKTAQQFSGDILNYNFTDLITKAYGNNQTLVDSSPNSFGIFSGDIDQDGNVNLSDVLFAYNDANTFVTGYKVSDVTGNNITDLSDVILTYNNSAGFTAVNKP